MQEGGQLQIPTTPDFVRHLMDLGAPNVHNASHSFIIISLIRPSVEKVNYVSYSICQILLREDPCSRLLQLPLQHSKSRLINPMHHQGGLIRFTSHLVFHSVQVKNLVTTVLLKYKLALLGRP